MFRDIGKQFKKHLWVATMVALTACSTDMREYMEIDFSKNLTPLTFTSLPRPGSEPSYKHSYVSIASLGQGTYAIANYLAILLFDRSSGSMCIAQFADGAPQNPTGVTAYGDRLYIANYKKNNILEVEVERERCLLSVLREFRSEDTGGPENVAISEDGKALVSANYDAGTVTAFNLVSGEQLWSAQVPQAHGVIVSGDRVFATGLTTREIYVIGLQDGSILRTGKPHHQNGQPFPLLWPTSINALSESTLVVADAHTGFISFIDKESLKIQKYVGGNGPTFSKLNYPYAAVPLDGELVVLSSMRGQLIFLQPDDGKVSQSYAHDVDNWSYVDEAKFAEPSYTAGKLWDGYRSEGMTIEIGRIDYELGYGVLYRSGKHSAPHLRLPSAGTFFNPGAYLYFTGGMQVNGWSVISSPSSQTAVALKMTTSEPPILVPLRVPMDTWILHGKAYGPREPLDVNALVGQAEAVRDRLENERGEEGILKWEGLLGVLDGPDFSVPAAIGRERFEKIFQTERAIAFRKTLGAWSQGSASATEVKQAAVEYYCGTPTRRNAELDEFVIIGLLAGIPITQECAE